MPFIYITIGLIRSYELWLVDSGCYVGPEWQWDVDVEPIVDHGINSHDFINMWND
jgi:hypothetical protein